jgi:hypothetical protein
VLVHDEAAAKLGGAQLFAARTVKSLHRQLAQHGFQCNGRGETRFTWEGGKT